MTELFGREDLGVGAEGEEDFGRAQGAEEQFHVHPRGIASGLGQGVRGQWCRGKLGLVDAQEAAQDLPAHADRDGQRIGNVVDAAAQGVPHVDQLKALAPPDGLVEHGGGQGAVGAE